MPGRRRRWKSHAEFAAGRSRDPVGLLLGQAQSRVPELVPVRHGRMLVSPFTFYRGAALPMAADLAGTPASGLRVQLCGDAHLSNFGAFASPERRPGLRRQRLRRDPARPVRVGRKRLAGACRGRTGQRVPAKDSRKIALAAAEGYRTAMRGFAGQPLMDVWYAHLDIEPVLERVRAVKSRIKAKRFKAAQALLAKAHTRDSTQALAKLTTMADGQRRIISDPPMIVADRGGFRRRAGRRDLRANPRRAGQVPEDRSPTGGTWSSSSPWYKGPQGSGGRQRRHRAGSC